MALEKRVEVVEGQIQHMVGVLDRLVVRQEKLDDAMEILADSHIKTQEQLQEMAGFLRETADFARETDRQWRERMRQMDEYQKARDQALDARIDKLVSGIGEFIRRQQDSKPN